MPYDNAASFNQTLTEVLKGDNAPAINPFCQSFIATFNADTQVAKMIATGKLEMSSSKTEEAAQLAATGILDLASLFQVPTGVLGDVTKKIISALSKGVRKKGYKKVTSLSSHMTHIELISESLTLGLILHYKDTLLDTKTASNPKEAGKKAAKRLLQDIKDDDDDMPQFADNHSLNQRLQTLLTWSIQEDQIRYRPRPGKPAPDFVEDDYATLLLFAAANILGLPRDHFVQAQKTEAKANELLDTIKSMEQEFDNIKQQIEQALKNNERPKHIFCAIEEGGTLKGTLSFDVGCIIDDITADTPQTAVAQQHLLATLKQLHQERLDTLEKQHELTKNQDHEYIGVSKDATLEEGGQVNFSVNTVKKTIHLTSTSGATASQPYESLPTKTTQPVATTTQRENTPATDTRETPSLGE